MGSAQHILGSKELASVIDSLREGIQIINREWRYVYLNGAAAAHGKRELHDLLGCTMHECYPGIEHTPMFAQLARAMNEQVEVSLQNEFSYPDGSLRTFQLRVRPCAVGILVLSIDITDELKLEAQFRHAQKMEAVGRLAGSVAHDFNNVLSVILSLTELLLQDLKPLDPLRADIEAIKKAGERGADLTKQLLAFSRQRALAPRNVNLNELVLDAEKMLRRLLGEHIEFVARYGRNLAQVRVDPGQIDQVILNLAVNARDAMPTGGKLTIETAPVMLDESYKTDHFGATPGPHIMLAVSDTGAGMDRATQSRIFEPFFTTKALGKGTGLGLATVFGIVQQCHGNIWVYSEPGHGTTFKIYFPVSHHADSLPPPVTDPKSLRGSETILVVEDQDDVRQVAEQVLRHFGYHVLAARNAGEALLTSERHPRTIQLLLTDVVMPQMSGSELAERLKTLRPGLKVLFMSGYTDGTVIDHGILDSDVAYLQKPLVPDTVARRVREVLDAGTR